MYLALQITCFLVCIITTRLLTAVKGKPEKLGNLENPRKQRKQRNLENLENPRNYQHKFLKKTDLDAIGVIKYSIIYILLQQRKF
jgi:hypothetical protein